MKLQSFFIFIMTIILLTACEEKKQRSVVYDMPRIIEQERIKRLEAEKNGFLAAKTMLSNKKISDDDWKTIAQNLQLVSIDNPSYQEAQQHLPRAQKKVAEIEKVEKKEQEAYERKTNLNAKINFVLRWKQILEGKYGSAHLKINGQMREILEVSLIRIDSERVDEILRLGIYNEAKNAKFLTIKFVDPYKQGIFISLNQ